jgi:STE24 endopeptidase
MNIYLVLILAFLIGNYLLDLLVRVLTRHSLSPDVPDEFRDLMDEEKHRRSQAYLRTYLRFGDWRITIELAATLAFILLGGFCVVDWFVRGFGFGMIFTGLIFLGVCALLNTLFHLPFAIYKTFVIERKYGFNKTTPRTFVLDFVKGILLTAAIDGVIFAAILWFFQTVGPLAWLYAWGAVMVILLIVQFVAPVLIMPLFNKYAPLPEGELKTALETYIHAQHFKMRGLFTMDGSRRSTHSNAFFTGIGRFRRIVLFDTLIDKHTVPELLTVVAHEMGHYKKHHVRYNIAMTIAIYGLIFSLLPLFLYNADLAAAFQMERVLPYAGLVFFGFLFTPISVFMWIFASVVSRRFEYQADAYAVTTTGQPESMIMALKKLNVDNYGHLTPHPFVVFVCYSHPPVLERIRAIRRLTRHDG